MDLGTGKGKIAKSKPNIPNKSINWAKWLNDTIWPSYEFSDEEKMDIMKIVDAMRDIKSPEKQYQIIKMILSNMED